MFASDDLIGAGDLYHAVRNGRRLVESEDRGRKRELVARRHLEPFAPLLAARPLLRLPPLEESMADDKKRHAEDANISITAK